MKNKWIVALALVSPALSPLVRAQDKPLSIDAKFSSGYYSTYTRGETDRSVNFVPAGATFDINGYYMMPELMNFWIQPQLNLGPQASEVGFEGGNGIRMRVNVLRQRAFPLTFRYYNVQLENVYYGSLSQVSAYSLKQRNKELGLTWELKPAGLPGTTIDVGTNGVDSKSGIAQVPDYRSHMNHINADTKYVRWGWDMDGYLHRQEQVSDLYTPHAGESTASSLQQTVTQGQGSARRSFFADSELFATAGQQSTSTLLLGLPLNLNTHYVSANLRMFQRRRWKGSLRGAYTSNLASVLLSQTLSSLAATPGNISPDAAGFSPVRTNLANLTLNGLTSVDLSHGVSLFGNVDRGALVNRSGQNGSNAQYFTTTGGISFAGKVRSVAVAGQYGRDYGRGSVTGQSGTISGQNYQVSLQGGTTDGLQMNGSLHGTDQSIRNEQPVTQHSFSAEGGLGKRVVGAWTGRVGAGWQNGTFNSLTSEFRTGGYTARVGFDHPRFQFSGSLNSAIGNSLPLYNQLAGQLALGALLLGQARTIPSNFRAISVTTHGFATRKLEFSGLWTHSLQRLDGIVANNLEVLDIHMTYHFRRIQIEAGYLRSNQIFSSYLATYPETERGRMYVRITRPAHIL